MARHVRIIDELFTVEVTIGGDLTNYVYCSEPLSSFFGAGTVFGNDVWKATLTARFGYAQQTGGESYGLAGFSSTHEVLLVGDADGSVEQYDLDFQKIGTDRLTDASYAHPEISFRLASGQFEIYDTGSGGNVCVAHVRLFGEIVGGPTS